MSTFLDGKRLPDGIWSGPGCRDRLDEALARLNVTRLLVIGSAGALRVAALADPRIVAVINTGPEGTTEPAIAAASRHAVAQRVDGVLSVGGGAAHDLAKAVALCAPSGRAIQAFLFGAPPAQAFIPLPVLAMPSTFSAAEMVAGGAVILTTGGKAIYGHPAIQPRAVFLDAELAASTPRAILAASGLNAVHHCTEALYSIGHQAMSDAWAGFALERLVRLLPALAPHATTPALADIQDMLEAASMSGLAYGISGLGIGHAICHSLAGRWDISHGNANAVVLPHSAAFNAAAAPDRVAVAVRAIGSADLVASLHALCLSLGTPRSLSAVGLTNVDITLVASDVLADPITATNPRPVAAADVHAILAAVQ